MAKNSTIPVYINRQDLFRNCILPNKYYAIKFDKEESENIVAARQSKLGPTFDLAQMLRDIEDTHFKNRAYIQFRVDLEFLFHIQIFR